MKQKNLFYISPFSNNWIHIFAPKPMTINKLAFQFFMMNIEHKMKLKLTIVIGFGAKIWIQSPNLFQKFQHVWRQLHLLSIVDYPNFQCSWLFLGLLMFFEWGKIFQAHFLGSISQKIWSFCMGWLICLKLQHLPTWHNHTNRTKK